MQSRIINVLLLLLVALPVAAAPRKDAIIEMSKSIEVIGKGLMETIEYQRQLKHRVEELERKVARLEIQRP